MALTPAGQPPGPRPARTVSAPTARGEDGASGGSRSSEPRRHGLPARRLQNGAPARSPLKSEKIHEGNRVVGPAAPHEGRP